MRQLLLPLLLVNLIACSDQQGHIALGTLERDRIAHTATSNEVVVALPVAQGSEVTKGTVLVKLDDTKQKAIVAKTMAEVAQATAHLEKLQTGVRAEEIEIAKANVQASEALVKQSEANYRRVKDLVAKNSASVSDLDRAIAQRDFDRASLLSRKEQLQEMLNGTRQEDLLMAMAQLEAAQAQVLLEQNKLADLTIRATRDGVLDNLPWNLGERVTTGSPLAVVLAGKAPYARVYIPQPYRVKMSVGQTFTVEVDGLPEPLTGKLRWVSNDPAFTPYYALNQEERARLMYLAEVQLPDSAASLPNGVPAQVVLP